ncbi:MAG TPA: serine hydrolase domain-containing protein, partial [Phytomonospora sp.]
MIRKQLLVLAAVAALLPVSVPAYGNPPGDRLHDLIAHHLDTTGTPGAALAVTTTGATTLTDTWGTDGDGSPVTAETPFLWGSVAKPVTATIVTSLGLDLSAPVGEYLPGFSPTWRGEPAAPAVGQLLGHTSGITRMTATDVGDNEPGAVTRVAARLDDYELDAAPGTAYAYNSSNYLLLGAVVEAVTGREYADVAEELVFAPAGMTGAVTGPADPVPPGHRQVFGRTTAYDGPYDLSGLPYGYLGGNIGDLAALGRFALAGGGASPAGDMWAPQPGTGDRYGLGWSLGELPGTDEPMVWHSGATPGYQAVLLLLPAKGIAVGLTQNTYSHARAEQLLNAAFDAARISAGHEPGDAYTPNA